MKNILIIGAGNIGYRHLQSLIYQFGSLHKIYVLDSSSEALQKAKFRAKEFIANKCTIYFIESMDLINTKIDLVISATDALPRFDTLRYFFSYNNTKFILEKFLFLDDYQYHAFNDYLNKSKSTDWVNCIRRIFPGYKELKKFLHNKKIKSFDVKGVGGILCNGIHFIDLITFFIGQSNFEYDLSHLHGLTNSKRKKYSEVHGLLRGRTSHFDFSLSSSELDTFPLISITTDKDIIIIDEGNCQLSINGTKNKFQTLYVSESTGRQADQILSRDFSELTQYKESMALHLDFLKSIRNKFGEINFT